MNETFDAIVAPLLEGEISTTSALQRLLREAPGAWRDRVHHHIMAFEAARERHVRAGAGGAQTRDLFHAMLRAGAARARIQAPQGAAQWGLLADRPGTAAAAHDLTAAAVRAHKLVRAGAQHYDPAVRMAVRHHVWRIAGRDPREHDPLAGPRGPRWPRQYGPAPTRRRT